MKTILRLLADIALLPVTGCIFPQNRDFSANFDRLACLDHKELSSVSPPMERLRPKRSIAFHLRKPLLTAFLRMENESQPFRQRENTL